MNIDYLEQKVHIQPRGGRSNIEFQQNLLDALSEAGADVLPLTIDSNTRLGLLDAAKRLHDESLEKNTETLNGFPLMTIDPQLTRELICRYQKPISLRHGTPFAHSLVERAIDVGVSEIEGGPISYSIPYSRDADLKKVFESWKNVEQLCASNNVLRENFGVLTAVLVPPVMAIAISILELFFSAKNGVRKYMIGLQASGTIQQDLCQFSALRKVLTHYKSSMFPHTNVLFAFHHWMGPFPKNEERAQLIINMGTVISHLVQANKVVIKTKHEAFGVPTAQANAESVWATRELLTKLASIPRNAVGSNIHSYEIDLLSEAAIRLIDSVLNSRTTIEKSIVYALEEGLLDLPFSPHQKIKKRIRTCRDKNSWIRIFDSGSAALEDGYILHETKSIDFGSERSMNDKVMSDIYFPLTNDEILNAINEELSLL